MNEKLERTIKEELLKLAVVFDVKASTEAEKQALNTKLKIYFEDLKDLNANKVLEAIKMARKTCKFFPRVSELISLTEESDEDLELFASKASNNAFERFRHKMLEGRGELPSFEDEITQHAFNLTLEEGDWREDAEQFNKWFRVKMKKNLINLHSAPSFQQQLELKEAEEKKARAALYE